MAQPHSRSFDGLPVQADVIARTLRRSDTLAVMPTGGGKSLCYQLPALLFDRLTLVVSPLIALMHDQVDQLRQLDVPAAFLNSTLPLRDYIAVTKRVRHGELMILYAAPETVLRPETLLLLEQSQLDCLAVDEAHCISEWGHDFRPEYRMLCDVRRRFPDAVCLALTATATARVRDDVPIMVATIAFGMGINKSNVRFVLHYHLPKDLESYYQEIGRAGRDGLPADCRLLYSRADAVAIRHFINQGAASERPGRQARLDALLRFAETSECRRAPLLAYFGEILSASCGYCDHCARELAGQFVQLGFLEHDPDFGGLRLTHQGRNTLDNAIPVRIPRQRQFLPVMPEQPTQRAHDPELFQRLRLAHSATTARPAAYGDRIEPSGSGRSFSSHSPAETSR